MLVYCKAFILKTVPGWIAVGIAASKKGLVKVSVFLGSWEAWSIKKLFRHCVKFIVSFSARIVILTFLINILFGRERKGLKNIPRFVMVKLQNTWLGLIIVWWRNASGRIKRILSGLVLCLILVAVGQAFVGISILVFDLVWECLIILSSLIAKAWRFTFPIVVRFIPNAIGQFFTNSVIPFFVNAIPYVREDFRVIYVRTNIRERYREYKKRLHQFSRSNRPALRAKISPLMPPNIRKHKNNLLGKAANLDIADKSILDNDGTMDKH